MQFQFSFKHMSVSDSLKEYAQKKFEEKVHKFATKPNEVHITFSSDKHLHRVHCSVKAGDGFSCEVGHECDNMYASVDRAVDKLEAQLRKQKEKLKHHKKPKSGRHLELVDERGGFDNVEIDAADILKYEHAKRKKYAV